MDLAPGGGGGPSLLEDAGGEGVGVEGGGGGERVGLVAALGQQLLSPALGAGLHLLKHTPDLLRLALLTGERRLRRERERHVLAKLIRRRLNLTQ